MKVRRKVAVRMCLDSWGVFYLDRKKGRQYKAALFYAKDNSREDVVAWVKKQPELELVEE
jgi:hypothetical protein